jgi:hypothetical protein
MKAKKKKGRPFLRLGSLARGAAESRRAQKEARGLGVAFVKAPLPPFFRSGLGLEKGCFRLNLACFFGF